MANKELREKISKKIDLSSTRLTDKDASKLADFTDNIGKYAGKSKTINHSFTGWCSDGKYTRNESTKYTVKNGKKGISIIENYSYRDDDGQTGGNTIVHTTGRAILKLLDMFM